MQGITRQAFLSQVALLAGALPLWASASRRRVPAARSGSSLSSSVSGSISLASVARVYSMKMTVEGRRIRLANRWNRVEVETNSRRAWINGVMVWLHFPCRRTAKGWTLRRVDFRKVIDPILRSYAYVPSRVPRLVVLDPGHGGKDTGAIGKRRVLEKLAVLSIAKKTQHFLEAAGVHTRLTRTDDTYLTLSARSALAARLGADLFVSIHADSAGSPSAHGVETFVLTAAGCDSSNHYGQGGDKSSCKGNLFDGANAVLGYALQRNLVKRTGRTDRGLRRARFAVLKNAPCPAALVECGFLSNPEEEALMIRPEYRERAARGIADGILAYIGKVRHAARH